MLQDILAVTGKPGLFKLVTRGNNMLIVESLLDGKRMPTYARDKIVSLADVSMFTMDEDMPLSEVLTKLGEKEGLKPAGIDPKKADNDQLREYFASFVPNFDRERVYPSDIRKLVVWYNVLIGAGITDFSVEEAEGAEGLKAEGLKAEGPGKALKAEGLKAEGLKAEEKKPAQKAAPKQVKTQKAAGKASAKTGVGAKKG